MANPQMISWTGPTTYTDGLPYGQSDHGGYEVEVNDTGLFAVPVGWNVNNTYEFPVKDLPGLKQGTNSVRMRTVAANGQVSDWTGVVTFPYLSIPNPPVNLAVA